MLGAPTSFQMENVVQLSTRGPRAPPHAKAESVPGGLGQQSTRFPCFVIEAGRSVSFLTVESG